MDPTQALRNADWGQDKSWPQRYASLAAQVGEGSVLTFRACGAKRNTEPCRRVMDRGLGAQTSGL
jgi:hypothetical protein